MPRRLRSVRTSAVQTRGQRYLNPWAFRRQSVTGEPAADLLGRPLTTRVIRHNGIPVRLVVHDEFMTERSSPDQQELLAELRRRVDAEIARYRSRGNCSDADLRMVTSFWHDGQTLRGDAWS